jgi:hypothetical protein
MSNEPKTPKAKELIQNMKKILETNQVTEIFGEDLSCPVGANP